MRVKFKFRNYKITKLQNSQRGYMLITLMLGVALIAIAMLAMLPEIGQQIKRDREEELRHRGTSYMRAIQRYYKKFGKYPSRLEELENTNNIRFLRKRYKDPITGKDFKILHPQDVALNNGPVLGQALGAGGLPGQPGAPGQQGVQGQLQQALGQAAQIMGGVQQPAPQAGQQKDADEDEAEGGNAANPAGGPASAGAASNPNSNSSTGTGFSGQVFGGGPILGVESASKAKTIREFNNKNHYNDWYFIYDPAADRGGLLVGPWQPANVQGIGGGVGQSVQGIVQGQGNGLPTNGVIQNAPAPVQTPQNPGQNQPPEE